MRHIVAWRGREYDLSNYFSETNIPALCELFGLSEDELFDVVERLRVREEQKQSIASQKYHEPQKTIDDVDIDNRSHLYIYTYKITEFNDSGNIVPQSDPAFSNKEIIDYSQARAEEELTRFYKNHLRFIRFDIGLNTEKFAYELIEIKQLGNDLYTTQYIDVKSAGEVKYVALKPHDAEGRLVKEVVS